MRTRLEVTPQPPQLAKVERERQDAFEVWECVVRVAQVSPTVEAPLLCCPS